MVVLTWKDVFQVHRKIRAAYVEAGHVKSMLFSQDRRRNRLNFRDGSILYFCFNNDSPEVKQVSAYLEVGDTFRVYEKVAPDMWADLGNHRCISMGDGMDASKKPSLVVTVKPVGEE